MNKNPQAKLVMDATVFLSIMYIISVLMSFFEVEVGFKIIEFTKHFAFIVFLIAIFRFTKEYK